LTAQILCYKIRIFESIRLQIDSANNTNACYNTRNALDLLVGI